MIVHAVATPYRERSHFDGQDVLESGLAKPGAVDYRLAQPRARGAASRRAHADPRRAGLRGRPDDAAGRARPGAGAVMGAAAAAAGRATTPSMRLLDLYRHTDPDACARARGAHRPRRDRARRRHDQPAAARAPGRPGAAASRRCAPISPRPPARRRNSWRGRRARASARSPSTAGTRMSTRARSRAGSPTLLGALDGAIARDRDATWATAWRETVVALVTEFGRTARINGNDGTDHGTATVALLAGGALKGGRVLADWPGLKRSRPLRGPRSASRRPICAPCSRACCATTCASTKRRWRRGCSPTARR